MNDRELLEMAAKAAGYKVRWHDLWQCHSHVGPNNTDNPPTLAGQRQIWSPLTDDGDALRLAVDLKIDVSFAWGLGVNAWTPGIDPQDVHYGEDRNAATRRAIVRAAAEIAKDMP